MGKQRTPIQSIYTSSRLRPFQIVATDNQKVAIQWGQFVDVSRQIKHTANFNGTHITDLNKAGLGSEIPILDLSESPVMKVFFLVHHLSRNASEWEDGSPPPYLEITGVDIDAAAQLPEGDCTTTPIEIATVTATSIGNKLVITSIVPKIISDYYCSIPSSSGLFNGNCGESSDPDDKPDTGDESSSSSSSSSSEEESSEPPFSPESSSSEDEDICSRNPLGFGDMDPEACSSDPICDLESTAGLGDIVDCDLVANNDETDVISGIAVFKEGHRIGELHFYLRTVTLVQDRCGNALFSPKNAPPPKVERKSC